MNEGESRLMEFQSGVMDQHSFFGYLFNAAFKADSTNKCKLKMGFPEEIEAVERWKSEQGYAQKLRDTFYGKGTIDGFRTE
jgi:hypothetical protein